ncbi:deoxyuridine triphosphatase [Colobine gammaherpesvirus 1]|uniref:Deoxyuridine triphosphatase n=1 Tax=Colobine gammaherpesvirus 1 TaxID=2597325 RepID=A0A5B8G419_9GAMA|nr:deoxyuridine triphosphatase [Colobine gammaherpesvirus 1]QDQ69261.1 deoxyuridine triphosphatase [Colobine gammaherpesvirus 1]
MDTREQWGPKVEYILEPFKFQLCSQLGSNRLRLVNQLPLLVRPGEPLIVPLGLHITRVPSCAFLLTMETENPLWGHVGLIDGGFKGEVKAILINKEEFPVTLHRGELIVCISAVNFTTPDLPPVPFLSRPRYALDAGFDVSATRCLYIPPRCSKPIELRLNIAAPEVHTPHVPVALGRSGLACRGLVIDICRWKISGLCLKLHNYSKHAWVVHPGDRICQIVFIDKKQLLQGWKKFLPHIKLAPGLCFRPANVMFFEDSRNHDEDNDDEQLLLDIPETESRETSVIRGHRGLGSSGVGD